MKLHVHTYVSVSNFLQQFIRNLVSYDSMKFAISPLTVFANHNTRLIHYSFRFCASLMCISHIIYSQNIMQCHQGIATGCKIIIKGHNVCNTGL